jgi:hypothetical protein
LFSIGTATPVFERIMEDTTLLKVDDCFSDGGLLGDVVMVGGKGLAAPDLFP